MDTEFPGGRGAQVEKSWKFQGVGGVLSSPLERKILRGGGVNLEKTLHGWVMDIFWNHTIQQIKIKLHEAGSLIR